MGLSTGMNGRPETAVEAAKKNNWLVQRKICQHQIQTKLRSYNELDMFNSEIATIGVAVRERRSCHIEVVRDLPIVVSLLADVNNPDARRDCSPGAVGICRDRVHLQAQAGHWAA